MPRLRPATIPHIEIPSESESVAADEGESNDLGFAFDSQSQITNHQLFVPL